MSEPKPISTPEWSPATTERLARTGELLLSIERYAYKLMPVAAIHPKTFKRHAPPGLNIVRLVGVEDCPGSWALLVDVRLADDAPATPVGLHVYVLPTQETVAFALLGTGHFAVRQMKDRHWSLVPDFVDATPQDAPGKSTLQVLELLLAAAVVECENAVDMQTTTTWRRDLQAESVAAGDRSSMAGATGHAAIMAMFKTGAPPQGNASH